MTNQTGYNQYTEEPTALANMVQPISEYRNTFIADCKANEPRISTGILSFDKALNGGFTNELYIMGAETSTGKSAFMMSIAEKIAESGTDVLYFALEMGRSELVARGISQISYKHHRNDKQAKAITAGNILYWTYDKIHQDFSKMPFPMYEAYCEEYFKRYGAHLYIIESGVAGLTAKDIANITVTFKRQSGKAVVVFVDYLQIIKADPEDHAQMDRKNKTDVSVTMLKTMASQVGMPVIAASSISRSYYQDKIGTSSFKESGDTEYTGGVLLGWNWSGVTDQKDKQSIEEEKRACKERGYRKMILDVLKCRNAEQDGSVHLNYYPAYNFFEEDTEWKPEKKKRVIRA